MTWRRHLLAMILSTTIASVLPGTDLSSFVVRSIRERGFAEVYAEVARSGTLLGLPADDAAGALIDPSNGLSSAEREMAALELVRRPRAAGAQAAVVATLLARAPDFGDWSLTGELLAQARDLAVPPPEPVLYALAERILTVLERRAAAEGDRGGRATAGAGLPRLDGASHPPDAAGYERTAVELARAVGAGVTGSLPLADTLREIARLSRDESVVTESLAAARTILGE